VRKELEEALESLTPDELLEARRYIDQLLATLEQSDGLARGVREEAVEQRAFERYSINLAVTYFRHGVASEGRGGAVVQDAVVRDIARGGVRFFTKDTLERGDLLTFYLPAQLGVRKLFVEVRWVKPRDGQLECGAAFVGLDRVFAAQKAELKRSEAVRMLVVCEPCAERDALADLLVKQGYQVDMANSVPEAVELLGRFRCALLLASAHMLKAEGVELLRAAEARKGEALSIALAEASELDSPENAALRRCHDYITQLDHPQEVRLIVARACQRLAAAQARAARI